MTDERSAEVDSAASSLKAEASLTSCSFLILLILSKSCFLQGGQMLAEVKIEPGTSGVEINDSVVNSSLEESKTAVKDFAEDQGCELHAEKSVLSGSAEDVHIEVSEPAKIEGVEETFTAEIDSKVDKGNGKRQLRSSRKVIHKFLFLNCYLAVFS